MESLPQAVRERARVLRRVEGRSFAEIAKELGVAPSTARRWTRDIDLCPRQEDALRVRKLDHAIAGSLKAAKGHRLRRMRWQAEGYARAKQRDPLHEAGCLLYWAEGTKYRNGVEFVNSDLDMVRLFKRFAFGCFELGPADVALSLNVYTDNGLSLDEIETRWLEGLELPRTCLRPHSLNKRPAPGSGRKKGKLPLGVACLRVRRSTWLAQHIYGALRVYGGFHTPRWLD